MWEIKYLPCSGRWTIFAERLPFGNFGNKKKETKINIDELKKRTFWNDGFPAQSGDAPPAKERLI